MEKIDLSIVIPAYKERERIAANLIEIRDHLEQLGMTYEVIVVVDGSHDGTADVVRSLENQIAHLNIVENELNQGKGAVVRQGLLLARGDVHAFLDADGSTSITHIDEALRRIDAGADLVVGSRDLPDSEIAVHQPRYREIMGTMGNWAIRAVLGLWHFPDTQCGFKVLTRVVTMDIVPRMAVDRFAYDFELIVLAKKRGHQIEQMPVRWVNEVGSTVGGIFNPNGFLQVLVDLAKTRIRLWTGFYKLDRDV